jgi:hypothetical protein
VNRARKKKKKKKKKKKHKSRTERVKACPFDRALITPSGILWWPFSLAPNLVPKSEFLIVRKVDCLSNTILPQRYYDSTRLGTIVATVIRDRA